MNLIFYPWAGTRTSPPLVEENQDLKLDMMMMNTGYCYALFLSFIFSASSQCEAYAVCQHELSIWTILDYARVKQGL